MTSHPLSPASFVPVAITDRSGLDESVHFGAAVALGADGSVVEAWGDPDAIVFPRSANKPLQADAMLRLGLEIPPQQLALACASHDGTPRHEAVVVELLSAFGRGVGDLQNTPSLPYQRAAADARVAAGGGPTTLAMNCSGKHAAMIATCTVRGWDPAGYLDPEHPLQVAITEHIAEMVEFDPLIGIDGCGAPTHAFPLVGLARAYRSLAVERGPVWAAMTAWPELVGGEQRDNTRLMRAVPDLMAKDGAEGIMAAAMPDGRAVVVKISDGQDRPAGIVAAAALRVLGVEVDTELGVPMLGHGRPVGRIRSTI